MQRNKLLMAAVGVLLVGGGLLFYFNPSFLSFAGVNTIEYSHSAFGVSFKYPENWTADPRGGAFSGIPLRYEGSDGYFGVDALAAPEEASFEDVVKQIVVDNPNKPYGSKPVVKLTQTGGLESRVVLPSDDQSAEAKNEALFIARYPEQIKIGDNLFGFFMLYAHKNYLEDILKTLRFNFPDASAEEEGG